MKTIHGHSGAYSHLAEYGHAVSFTFLKEFNKIQRTFILVRSADFVSDHTMSKNMFRLLFLAALVHLSRGVPNGFIDEGITDLIAITGAFAPNPRNEGKPMLLLSPKEGTIMVLEDPDNNDDMNAIADLEGIICANGECGLQTIRPHPDFAENWWL
jgi:hypothetical protein